MTTRKKKESNLLPGEFYCYKCNEYMEKNMRHSKVSKHCVNCQIKIVAANKLKKENVVAVPKQSTLNARERKQRSADLMDAIEHKKIVGNHLVDYL